MRRRGFTLIELLIVIGVLSLLMAILLPALGSAVRSGRAVACLSNMRQIGMATLSYARDNDDRLPRSTHSAMANGCEPWGYAISRHLGTDGRAKRGPVWDGYFNGILRCPEDCRREHWSYGKNVWFELESGEAAEALRLPIGPTWPTLDSIPRPAQTVLFGELGSGAGGVDHVMAHFWYMGGAPEVDAKRHPAGSNYVFADGHAGARPFHETFDLARKIDLWCPQKAP